MPADMIGSMSSTARKAWRIFLLAMTPSLWFGTAVIQPYGFEICASRLGWPFTRSTWSCRMLWAKLYSPVSAPARRTEASGTGLIYNYTANTEIYPLYLYDALLPGA